MIARAGTLLTKYWDAFLASAVACIFVYLFTHHSGIGISPDSVMYGSTAINIKEHFSFSDFNGLPLVDFPLGYPVLLASLSFLFRTDVYQLAPFVNAILFCGSIFLTAKIMLGFRKSSLWIRVPVLSLIACSPCLLEVYNMLWSETVFLFLIFLLIVLLRRYLLIPSIRSLVPVALVCAIALVIRYAGICLLASSAFLVCFFTDQPLRKRIKHLFFLTCTGISLVLVNIIRNRIASGNSTGVREKALRGIGDNLLQIGGVFTEWLPFLKGKEALASIVFIALAIIAVAIILFHLLQQQYYPCFENIVAVFFITYACFIIAIASVSRFENLSSRLLSPMYIPLLLLLAVIIGYFIRHYQKPIRFAMIGGSLLLLAAFHHHHYQLNAEAWEGIKDAGMPGYTEDSWTQSPAVAYIREHKQEIIPPVFGNANDAVYFLTGIRALPLPHKEIPKEIETFLQQDRFYLVWFRDGENTDLISLDFIKQKKRVEIVQELEDGILYRVDNKP